MNTTNYMLRFLLIVLVSITAGCAKTGQIKHIATSNILYTNSPLDTAYDASRSALETLKYTIVIPDRDNYYLQAKYFHPLTSNPPLYAEIEMSEEISGAKIITFLDRPGGLMPISITGVTRRYTNNIYREIEQMLTSQGYTVQRR